ncbi:11416_t:CDS:2 [Acaulospora morrowiae]|uniref:11416_t:CDS:1 n=1 Tax=Acaulospora morrowiae TaxID=94023 RepID=A0A9N8VNB9_9GLOM|nr:11416_t:CDS:2 [Acaulospora morrowiae]
MGTNCYFLSKYGRALSRSEEDNTCLLQIAEIKNEEYLIYVKQTEDFDNTLSSQVVKVNIHQIKIFEYFNGDNSKFNNTQGVHFVDSLACKISNITISDNLPKTFQAKLVNSTKRGDTFLLENHICTSADNLKWVLDDYIVKNPLDHTNDIYLEIQCPRVEIIVDKELIMPFEILITNITKALEHTDPYHELLRVFRIFGHFLPSKIILGHKVYKMISVSRNKPAECINCEDFAANKNDILDRWKEFIRPCYFDSPYLVSINGEIILEEKLEEWMNSCLTSDTSSLDIINWNDLYPLYEILEKPLRQVVKSVLGIDDQVGNSEAKEKVLMVGIISIDQEYDRVNFPKQSKSDKIKEQGYYYRVNFPRKLKSNKYKIFGKLMTQNGESIDNVVVKFRSMDTRGFSARIEKFEEKELNNLQITWLLIGSPAQIGFYSRETRDISVLRFNSSSFIRNPDVGNWDIQLEDIPDILPSGSILITSFAYPLSNIDPNFITSISNYADNKITVNVRDPDYYERKENIKGYYDLEEDKNEGGGEEEKSDNESYGIKCEFKWCIIRVPEYLKFNVDFNITIKSIHLKKIGQHIKKTQLKKTAHTDSDKFDIVSSSTTKEIQLKETVHIEESDKSDIYSDFIKSTQLEETVQHIEPTVHIEESIIDSNYMESIQLKETIKNIGESDISDIDSNSIEETHSRPRNNFNQINHTRNKISTPGLSNLGNTCFFNSVMQVVTVTSALRDVLQPNCPGQFGLIPPLINAEQCLAAVRDDVGPLTNTFKEFLSVMWEGEREVVSPRDLFDQITRKWSQFRGWRQQDSQELMRFLFDGIKSEELELIKRVSKKKNEDQLSDQGTDDENNTSKEKSPPQEFVSFIDACFGGKLASVIVCKTCRMCSYSYEEFLDVSLPIKFNNHERILKKVKTFFTGSNNSTQSFYNSLEDSSQNGDDKSNNSNKEAKPEEYSPLLKEIPDSSDRSTQNSCISLIDCLRSFMRVETLDGDNLFACGNCWKNLNHEGSDVTDVKSDAEEDDSIKPDVRVDKAIGEELTNIESLKQSPSTPISTSEVSHMTNTQPENGVSEPMDVSGDTSMTDTQIYETFGKFISEDSSEHNSVNVPEPFLTDTDSYEDQNNSKSEESSEFISINFSQGPHITSTNAPDENSNEPISRDYSEKTCVSGADAQFDENPQKSISEDSEETRISGTDVQSDGISNNSISEEGAHVTSTDTRSDENPNNCSNDLSDFTPINGKDGEIDSRGMEVDLPVQSSLSRNLPLHDSESEKNKSTKAQQFILREAYKRYLFSSLPPVLVLHLKRFQQTGKWMKKIDDFVEFDEEIDVGNFIVPPGADDIDGSKSSRKKVLNTKYRLYGVVVHIGSLYNGHYIAYVLSKNILETGEQFGVPELNPDDYEEVEKIHSKSDMVGEHKQWIYCSDSNVRMAKVDEVLRSEAYLLFYEQVI